MLTKLTYKQKYTAYVQKTICTFKNIYKQKKLTEKIKQCFLVNKTL